MSDPNLQHGPNRACRRAARSRAFTLIELLIVICVVTLLVGILLPTLGSARESARSVRCASNLRQVVIAWTAYAGEYRDRAMPLAYWSTQDIGSGPQIFWWGSHGTSVMSPDFSRGFLAPYLSAGLHAGSLFECPSQAWGTYRPQGPSRSITSTYGYNGYFLSPAKTPGWGDAIGHRPWQRVSSLASPSSLVVFADTLLPGPPGTVPGNNALLDPPLLFDAGTWVPNPSPTSAFRHARRSASALGSCVSAFADGHAASTQALTSWLTHPHHAVGSMGGLEGIGASYVPDWTTWRSKPAL